MPASMALYDSVGTYTIPRVYDPVSLILGECLESNWLLNGRQTRHTQCLPNHGRCMEQLRLRCWQHLPLPARSWLQHAWRLRGWRRRVLLCSCQRTSCSWHAALQRSPRRALPAARLTLRKLQGSRSETSRVPVTSSATESHAAAAERVVVECWMHTGSTCWTSPR